jgi:hypothetical protein
MLQIIGAATLIAISTYFGWKLHENKISKLVVKNLTKAFDEKYGKKTTASSNAPGTVAKRNNVLKFVKKDKG